MANDNMTGNTDDAALYGAPAGRGARGTGGGRGGGDRLCYRCRRGGHRARDCRAPAPIYDDDEQATMATTASVPLL